MCSHVPPLHLPGPVLESACASHLQGLDTLHHTRLQSSSYTIPSAELLTPSEPRSSGTCVLSFLCKSDNPTVPVKERCSGNPQGFCPRPT